MGADRPVRDRRRHGRRRLVLLVDLSGFVTGTTVYALRWHPRGQWMVPHRRRRLDRPASGVPWIVPWAPSSRSSAGGSSGRGSTMVAVPFRRVESRPAFSVGKRRTRAPIATWASSLRERGAEARMKAAAERHVLVRVGVVDERVGRSEYSPQRAGRGWPSRWTGHQHGPALDRAIVDLVGLQRDPAARSARAREAQQLVVRPFVDRRV